MYDPKFWGERIASVFKVTGRSGGRWSNWAVGNQRSVRVLTHGVHLMHSRDVLCRSYKHVTDRPSCRNQTFHWQSEKRKHQGSSSPTNIPQHRMWAWCIVMNNKLRFLRWTWTPWEANRPANKNAKFSFALYIFGDQQCSLYNTDKFYGTTCVSAFIGFEIRFRFLCVTFDFWNNNLVIPNPFIQ